MCGTLTKLTGGQAIAQTLRSYGIDTIFGLPGVQLDNTFDALYEMQDDIHLVHTRHEQATSYMALGYAQSTGKVGVSLVVPGPGLLNASGALSTAYATNAPILQLTGQIRSDHIGKGYGDLHEIPHQLRAMQSVSKWQARAESAAETPGLLREAFKQLTTGRPRPVVFEMAPDVMGREEEVELLDPIFDHPRPEADPDQIKQAAQILASAKKPAIFVGGGIFEAQDELHQLMELLEAPVVMSQSARGVVSDRDYHAQTMLGGRMLMEETDAAIAIGTRFSGRMGTAGGFDPSRTKLIRVDIDPEEVDRYGMADVAIVADAGKAIAALVDELGRIDGSRASRKDELSAIQEKVNDLFFELQPQHEFTSIFRDELPDDGRYVLEITQLGFFAQFGGFPVYEPRTMIHAGFQGTLGFGFATALGTQVAHPDKKVLSINGDGGFMYTMPELSTAVRHKIPLVAVVFNDGAFGNVKRIQRENYNGRTISSDLTNPDFVKLAESFGAAGIRATNAEELRKAVREGFDNNHPTLIDVPVGELPSVWDLVFR